jgi:hypothetical protein
VTPSNLRELDAQYGTLDESKRRKLLGKKGGSFDPYSRSTCLRRAAKALFDSGIEVNLCFDGLATALEAFMRAHPEKLLALLESIVVDWPDKVEFMDGIAAILSSEAEPFVPSFSDFDVDEPTMIRYYACLLRQRFGGPLPVSL